MTWKVYEEANKRVKAFEAHLTKSALADLQQRGYEVHGKSLAEIKHQIAERAKKRRAGKLAHQNER